MNPFIVIAPHTTATWARSTARAPSSILDDTDGQLALLGSAHVLGRRIGAVGGSTVGDFFAMGWGKYAPLSSLAVCVNPGSAFNSYWPMPFRKGARITMENLDDQPMRLYYQIDYTQTKIPEDAAYFHASSAA